MARAFISNLLKKSLQFILPSELHQEVKAAIDIDENIEKLRSTFLMLQAVVEDAERKQLKNPAVKLWLDRLKEVCYDADDLFDQWDTENKIAKKKGTGENHLAKKVRTIVDSFFSTDHIVHKVGNIQNQLDEIARDKAQFNLIEIQSCPEPRLETSSFIKKEEVYGREDDKQIILSKLLSEGSGQVSHVPVICVVGTAGFGKTTLSQIVFNDLKVAARFQKKMWVCISQPFDMKKVAKELIGKAGGKVPNSEGWDSLHKSLCDAVKGKRFLLVLDDVWEYSDELWGPLMFSLDGGSPGSRVLVTTRDGSIAEKMTFSSNIHLLKRLSDDDCWELFLQRALRRGNEDPAMFKEIGRKISDKCKGVPLAATVLSSLMSFKDSVQDWKDVLGSNLWEEMAKNANGLQPELFLSYYALPQRLKPCFVYCAIFPKDTIMKKDVLVKLWMAEGFVDYNGTDNLEIIGRGCFNGLAMRSFFQDFVRDVEGNIVSCKMHDLVHDFAQFLMYGAESPNQLHDFAHLCRYLHSPEIDDPSIYELKNLRTLIQPKVLKGPSVCDLNNLTSIQPKVYKETSRIFHDLLRLRVLDLQDCSIPDQLPQKVDQLLHLRYLCLNGTEISELPESVCNLLNLQTLRLEGCCNLRSLPERIGELCRLRHLELEKTDALLYLPESVGKLSSLRTLCKFIVGTESNRLKIEGLKLLSNLQGKLKITGLENIANVIEVSQAELKKKKNLLSVTFGFERGFSSQDQARHTRRMELILKGLEPPEGLTDLQIKFYPGHEFPFWVSSLPKLVKLTLSTCKACIHLPSLGKLAFLEVLRLYELESVKCLEEDFYGVSNEYSNEDLFPKLKELYIMKMQNLVEWKFPFLNSRRIMPRLSELTIFDCPKLNPLPYHEDSFPVLRKLDIKGCSSEILAGAGNLRSLETLEVRKLRSLQYLDQGLSEISQESNVQELKFTDIDMWTEWCLPLENDVDVFTNLVKLQITSCRSLLRLPALGGIRNLESLKIYNLPRVTEVGLEFLGMSNPDAPRNKILIFPRLKILEFKNIPEWKKWDVPFETKNIEFFPHLLRLEIENCNKLSELPALGKLNSLISLRLYGLHSVQHLGSDFLGISGNDNMVRDVRSITVFPMLKRLSIRYMDNWEMGEERLTNERDRGGPISVMPCLEKLTLTWCPMLTAVPRYMFSGSLKELEFSFLPKLSSSRAVLPSILEDLRLEGDLGDFSKSLPIAVHNSYHKLKVVHLSDSLHESLPKGFDRFTAIQRLYISKCNSLVFGPDEFRHLNVLQTLAIDNCRLLSKCCINGENWSTTSRTPGIWIDGKEISVSYNS